MSITGGTFVGPDRHRSVARHWLGLALLVVLLLAIGCGTSQVAQQSESGDQGQALDSEVTSPVAEDTTPEVETDTASEVEDNTPEVESNTTPPTAKVDPGPEPVATADGHMWIYPLKSAAQLEQTLAAENLLATPADAASLFVSDYLGYEPLLEPTNLLSDDVAYVDFHTGQEPGSLLERRNTIELHRFASASGDDAWVVIEVRSPDNRIDAPASQAAVGSAFAINGTSSGFEANTSIVLIPDFARPGDASVQTDFVTSGWNPTAFYKELNFAGTTSGLTVMLVETGAGEFNRTEAAMALRRFVFEAGAAPLLSNTEVVEMASVTGVDADDTLSVRSGPGVANELISTFEPNRRGVVLTGDRESADSSEWAEVEISRIPGNTGWVNTSFLTNAVDAPRGVAHLLNSPIGNPELLPSDDLEVGLYPQRDVAVAVNQWDLSNPNGLNGVGTVWGAADDTGDPVEMTLSERLQGFEDDPAITDTAQISVDAAIGSGNTTNTLADDYPDEIIVESHHPGTDEFDGLNWSSVIFVIRPLGDQYRLVGLYDHGWTI